ncbi:MAG TPA: YbjN domain-containing protein [Aggregatilineales bacterium]|jgi:hypothetical protein|nr:YbjN domain-containing protein [Aggregatilineales bacterium]
MAPGPIFDTVSAFYEGEGWNPQWLEGTSVLTMGYSGKAARWVCYADARDDAQQFVLYSISPINAPEHRRHAVAEFITRANFGLTIGSFEMDYADGEIRFKTAIDVEGAQLVPALIRQMTQASVFAMETYLPGILSVIYGGVEPADAIMQLESTLRRRPPAASAATEPASPDASSLP